MKIKYIMYKVQDYSVRHNNVVREVTCEVWRFTRIHVEIICMTASFHYKSGGLGP